MSKRKCEFCGNELVRRRGEDGWKFNRRRFCSRSCVARAHPSNLIPGKGDLDLASRVSREHAERRRQAVIEDLEWIIDTDAPERVAHRLGYANPHSLERLLLRWDRPDLAAKMRVVTAA